MRRRLAALLLAALGMLGIGATPRAARADAPPPPRWQDSVPGASLLVTVVTFGQGELVWERFGHNAIWVQDRATGMSTMWHWGLFDFQQPNFVGRFLTGDTRYWMEGFDGEAMLAHYREYDRTITVQQLAMTPAQRLALLDFLRWNEQEANKFYRYDYYRDNCSTRLRDALDRALGGLLAREMRTERTALTHRGETLRLVEGMGWTQAGMDVALGHPADVPMTTWEAAFVPMRLRDRLRTIRVPGPAGTPVPLVAREEVLYESTRPPEAAAPPLMLGRFAMGGALLALLLAGFGALAAHGFRAARGAFGVVGVLWALAPGLLGVALALAWGATRHDFWDRNENLFQLGPQSLPLLVLVPMAIVRPAWRARAARWAAVVVVVSLVGLVLKLLPAFRQPNLDVIALALPAHAALAWALARLRASAG